MADAVVSVVLESVGRLLAEEAASLSGVSARVEDLCSELRHMQSFLRDADAKQHTDERVCNLVREIRSVSYRIEDLVETYAIRAEAKKSPRRGIKKFVRNPLHICGKIGTLRKLANEIEDVKGSISKIITNFQKYGIIIAAKEEGESSNQEYQQRARQTYDHEIETYFVGMEKDIENLVSLVTSRDDNKHIVSIWGMGGLGKTTVARKVYKHEDARASFDRFAWKCITQEVNVDQVLGDLLMQLVPGKERDVVRSMTSHDLVTELHDVQMKTKCLIVLDDMWEVDHWQAIRKAFPLHGGKSKLLLTTRNRNVAEIGCAYELKFLSESEGWELLQNIASSSKTDLKIASCFEEIGTKLVTKCGGLPLAICLLGGILKDKNSLASWEIVNKDVSRHLNSMIDGDRTSTGSLGQVLSLSYNDLPYHLKFCFLYLANFREDETVSTHYLYSLWMSEGLILSANLRNGETLMDVGDGYLRELGHRCMVQLEVNGVSLIPNFLRCSLHDVMREFCLEKCREQEFLKVVSDSSYLASNSRAHRLVIYIENKNNAAAMLDSIEQHDAKHTRSLFCLHPTSRDSEDDQTMIWPQDRVLKNFKSLRVLCLERLDFGRKFPLELQNLIHLRSLTLLECQLDELPSSIANLPFLDTLILYLKGEVKIPNVIWKMKRLQRLGFGLGEHYTDVGGKLRLHGLRELATIWGLDSEVDEIADLMELVNIRDLHCKVTGIDNFYVLMEYIHGKNGQNLREMGLEINDCDLSCTQKGYDLLANSFKGERLRVLILSAKLVEFPCYDQYSLPCLRLLNLANSHIKEDPMETFGRLPHLEALKLGTDSYMGQNLICRGFPKLHTLVLYGLPNLIHWRVEEGSMLNLLDLQIWTCPLLAILPDGLRFAKKLKTLVVGDMSTDFCDRLKEGGDDYCKIQHVPSVVV